MIYAAVCGGAFGLEEMVSGAGPGLSLAVLALMPLAFSLPVSLVAAEMTARFQWKEEAIAGRELRWEISGRHNPDGRHGHRWRESNADRA